MEIPRKLVPLLQKPKRFKVAIGGRGSGKSNTFADIFLMKMQTEAARVACFREFQNSIDDSVHSLFKQEISRLGVPGFNITNNAIDHESGGAARFRGLARNAESIKSMSGFNYFFVEEAQTISQRSLEILTPTLRTKGSEIWMCGNPGSSADPFSQKFIVPFQRELDDQGYYEDDLHLIIKVNYCDNPFFPEVLELERQNDERVMDHALYRHIWLGGYNDTVQDAIISVEWFNAAIDAHKKLGFAQRGQVVCSHDPSDTGPDPKGIAIRHGSVFTHIEDLDHGDVNSGCDWAIDLAVSHGADLFTWDCDGMGVSLRRQVEESLRGKKCDFLMFKGSEAPEKPDSVYQAGDEGGKDRAKTNRQTFKNKRAQYYWRLRDRFYNTWRAVVKGDYVDPDDLISISSDIKGLESLKSEVCRIPRKHNGSGLIQIMNKIEMFNRFQLSSPNRADAMMMAMVQPEPQVKRTRIEFEAW